MEDFTHLYPHLYPHLKDCTEVIEREDGLALRIVIDTKRHRYLNDHVFGGMCLVPATMIMELLMEAALWYTRRLPGKEQYFPVGLHDINIERALAVAPGGSLEALIDLQSHTEASGQLTVSLRIHSERKSASGERVGSRVNTTAQVLLAEAYPTAPAVEARGIDYYRQKYSIPQSVYYSYYFLALGPLFHSCTGNIAFDKEKREFMGVYNCAGKEAHFIEGNEAPFLSSPLGNDSCLQYAVFFSRILAITGRLPIGGKQFTQFRKHPLEGEVTVYIKCLHIDEEIMLFDFHSFNDKSELIAAGKEFKVKKSPYHKEFDGPEFFNVMDRYSL